MKDVITLELIHNYIHLLTRRCQTHSIRIYFEKSSDHGDFYPIVFEVPIKIYIKISCYFSCFLCKYAGLPRTLIIKKKPDLFWWATYL